ncbi:hypothetical protein C0971_02510 [Bacillus methanolicus]|uniref:hypothetical protein n=1 Tax=Bacillus methanolicus TaxID=1471 RepID=UPI00200DE76E|nr:hypothetical protein [Bacillus methanolicus]UQD51022.1 hypothetical protein C0971_02510 [Bacillus methanolicus]
MNHLRENKVFLCICAVRSDVTKAIYLSLLAVRFLLSVLSSFDFRPFENTLLLYFAVITVAAFAIDKFLS